MKSQDNQMVMYVYSLEIINLFVPVGKQCNLSPSIHLAVNTVQRIQSYNTRAPVWLQDSGTSALQPRGLGSVADHQPMGLVCLMKKHISSGNYRSQTSYQGVH